MSPFVEAGALKVETLSGDQIERMKQTLADLRIGVEDQSVLVLAIERKAVLITGDRRLRIEAGKHNIDIQGLLWILDELVARGVIQPALAAVRLRLMRENGAWLPNDECDERFRRWKADKPAR